MPVCRRWAYLDNAAVAPLSAAAQDAISTWSTEAAEEGDTVWVRWAQQVEQARALAASLVNADPEEMAFVPNTTTGISLVAEGFPWEPGDNVVTLANEFPSNQYPWIHLRSRGVETRRVPVEGVSVDFNRIAEACDSRTRIIAASWVGYATGWRMNVSDLAQLAHDRGALLFLDAIQGLGVFPLDVRSSGVDFFAADGHKWLLAPEGAGLFFVRREHLPRLRPLGVGWHSVVQDHDFSRIELELKPAASRYEGGSQNTCGLLALGASLELLREFGLGPQASAVANRVLEITSHASRRLEQIGARIVSDLSDEQRSGIIAFDLPGRDLEAERRRCFEAGVALSKRHGWLRISPHAYANENDIERLVAALER
jgi:selenocysteine lyase/cysteine desulfurase